MLNKFNANKGLLSKFCSVVETIDNGGEIERVYKCANGDTHYIPESLLFELVME